MTIPEAAQLVIQAGSMGQGGDVFVLDMGQPVRIADLALRMIQLMGLMVRDEGNPQGDIAIEYTGLRPGEKLYEELLIGDNVSVTDHPKIRRACEESLAWPQVLECLTPLVAAANNGDCEQVRQLLLDTVNGFRPACEHIEDLVWQRRFAPPRPARRPVEEPAPAALPGLAPVEAHPPLVVGLAGDAVFE